MSTAQEAVRAPAASRSAPLARPTQNVADRGLAALGNLGAMARPKSAVGRPAQVRLELIHSDPDQPRGEDNPGFSAESLGELADSIRAQGVRSPVSLREWAERPGHFIVNHGERRCRASRLAGLDTVPAFLDSDHGRLDQAIENIQREALTAREIADFLGGQMANGMTQGELGKQLGKSQTWVSHHLNLLSLPDPVRKLFDEGRMDDVTLLAHLSTEHRRSPKRLERWIGSPDANLTRAGYRAMQKLWETEGEGGPARRVPPTTPPRFAGELVADHEGDTVVLVLDRRPKRRGEVWVRRSGDETVSVPLVELRPIEVAEGRARRKRGSATPV